MDPKRGDLAILLVISAGSTTFKTNGDIRRVADGDDNELVLVVHSKQRTDEKMRRDRSHRCHMRSVSQPPGQRCNLPISNLL